MYPNLPSYLSATAVSAIQVGSCPAFITPHDGDFRPLGERRHGKVDSGSQRFPAAAEESDINS